MKTRELLYLTILCLCLHNAYAQTIEWQKSLGGSLSEQANAIQQTSDGGYIATGFSLSNDKDVTTNAGKADIWLVKLSDLGSIVWQKSFGGPGDDKAYSLLQTMDGGYIVAGSKENDGNNVDYWILKLSKDGNLEWDVTYGGSDKDEASSIVQNIDGSYIVAGTSQSKEISNYHGASDAWVLKLDSFGVLLWESAYGGPDYDEAASLQITKEGGYIVGGSSFNLETSTGSDFWVLKLDANGNEIWDKKYDNNITTDYGKSIKQTDDGGYIIVGFTQLNDIVLTSYWILKLTDTGNIEWKQHYGSFNLDIAFSVEQTLDGGYVVAGQTSNVNLPGNYIDFGIVKLDHNGNIVWEKIIGGSDVDAAAAIQQTNDGGLIIAGYSNSKDGDVTGTPGNHGNLDFWIVKFRGYKITGQKEMCIESSADFTLNPKEEGIIPTWSVTNNLILFPTNDPYSVKVLAISPVPNVGIVTATLGTVEIEFLVNIISNVPNAPDPIIGPTGMCGDGGNAHYSINQVPGANFYIWSLVGGATGNPFETNFDVSNITDDFTIQVKALNSCGGSEATTKFVDVKPLPAKPGSISGPSGMCPDGGGAQYTINSVPGAISFTWKTIGPVTNLSGNGTTGTVDDISGSFTIKVKSNDSNCSSEYSSRFINVLSPNAPGCGGKNDPQGMMLINDDSQTSIYPNPGNNFITIKGNYNSTPILIYDKLTLVLSTELNGENPQIDISTLRGGNNQYIIKVNGKSFHFLKN